LKKTIITVLALAFLFVFSGKSHAQDFITGSLTAQAAACPTNPGNSSSSTSAITLAAVNAGGVTFTIGSTTFSATVAFFASGDGGTTWQGLNVFPSSSTTPVTGANTVGLWQANVAGYTHVCMVATAFVSGTVTVTMRKSTASARAGGGGGSGLPAGGLVGQAVVNTGSGTGSWQSAGIPLGNGGAAVTTTPYTVQCDSGAAIIDRLTMILLQSGASVVTVPQSSASGCGSAFTFAAQDDGAGTVTFNRTGSDTFNIANGSTNTDAATSFTLTNGQFVTLSNGASTVWEVRITAGGGASLSTITAATGSSTLANGNNPLTWNWAITTDAQDGHAYGETAAATGGTLTNGLANQAILSTGTATNSTATPFEVAQGSITNTVATPAMQVEATWNNAGLAGRGILLSVVKTAAAAGAQLLTLNAGAAGTTAEFNVDTIGNVTTSGAVNAVGPFESTANSTAVVYQGGQDAGTGAALGAATLRGADNSQATTGSAGGAATVRGGDATGGTNNTTGGAVTIRGGNVASTGTPVPGAVSLTGGGLTGAATNVAGADVTISGGLGTGNATPSHVILKEPAFVSASGTGAQANVNRFTVHAKAGSTSSATATNMFNIAVAANQTIGVEVLVHVETTQATPQNCSTTETFFAAVQNTAGTITQQTTGNGSLATICSTGTLTLAAAFTGANPAVFSVTPSWTTIAPSAVIITIEIHNLSQQDVTLL
jgi:hypothetical protein